MKPLFSTSSALDWLYPPLCVLCETSLRKGQNICHPCREKLPRLPASSCRKCGQTFEANLKAPEQCPNCISLKPQFDFATAALKSHQNVLHLIHQFKLLHRPEIGEDLAQTILPSFQQEARLTQLTAPLLIPVPLHHQRHRERGFNQAELLATPLARELGLDCLKALKRIRSTSRQATLSRRERLKNLNKAFRLTGNSQKLANRSLILIDDVFTTGSTVHECARTLRAAKPASIAVFTVLRA